MTHQRQQSQSAAHIKQEGNDTELASLARYLDDKANTVRLDKISVLCAILVVVVCKSSNTHSLKCIYTTAFVSATYK